MSKIERVQSQGSMDVKRSEMKWKVICKCNIILLLCPLNWASQGLICLPLIRSCLKVGPLFGVSGSDLSIFWAENLVFADLLWLNLFEWQTPQKRAEYSAGIDGYCHEQGPTLQYILGTMCSLTVHDDTCRKCTAVYNFHSPTVKPTVPITR